MVNVRAESMVDCIKEAHLNVIWQVIRVGLMDNINFKSTPGLKHLLLEDETPGNSLNLILLFYFAFFTDSCLKVIKILKFKKMCPFPCYFSKNRDFHQIDHKFLMLSLFGFDSYCAIGC